MQLRTLYAVTTPFLSVCLCTAERPAALRETLTGLARAAAPARPWELLVVNNRPEDRATRDVLAGASGLPLVTLDEPRAGLSHARNRAVSSSRGALLLFTDDDVTVDARWLQAYEDAALEHSDVTVFGGPIRPVFEDATPAWIAAVEAHVPTSFAWLDPQGDVLVASEGDGAVLPFGANFAVRAATLGAAPFDPSLGRQPGAVLLGGEETRVLQRLLAGGERGVWLHDAPVVHRIHRERMTRAYQQRYWHGIGYGEGTVEALQQRHKLARHAAHIERRLKAARRRWRLRGWRRRIDIWLPVWRDLSRLEGRMEGFTEAVAEAAR